jgi:ribosome-associated translation inhibitor RaiA
MTNASVAASLQLTHGFHASELERIIGLLARLDERMKSFREDAVELHLGVKERDTVSQRMVLEARVAGRPTMVATSEISDVDAAIAEVRDDLIRQITDAKNRTEPQNNRQLRNS